ncbi:MAG: VOC family protein, partial [Terriglobales bacterium]
AEPPVNLTLNEAQHCCLQGLSHLGIRVETLEQIAAARQRLEAAGYSILEEKQTTCCYALQDKIWAKDPSGYRWEVYVFHGDAEAKAAGPTGAVKELVESVCCAPSGATRP